MSEARGHKELSPILGAEFIARPLPECRAAFADIHRHVEDRPPPAAHELVLRMRRRLEM